MKRMVKRIVSGLFVYSMVRLIMGVVGGNMNETYAIIAIMSGTYLACSWMIKDMQNITNKKKANITNKYKKKSY